MMTGAGSVNPSATGPDRKPRFILFKQHVVTAHDSHFAGGKHAFSSMACKLAEEGHDVHVVSIAERSKVLVHAAMTGVLPWLEAEGPCVVGWATQPRLRHHVVFKGEAGPYGGLGAVVAALVRSLSGGPQHGADTGAAGSAIEASVGQEAAPKVLNSVPSPVPSAGCWVVVDADESQKPLPAPPSHTLTHPYPPAADPHDAVQPPLPAPPAAPSTLFEAVVGAAPPGCCLALVQNVHFLPLGPSGTAPRSASLLRAWSAERLGGVVAVSRFVAHYLQRHWPGQGGGGEAKGGAAGSQGEGGDAGGLWPLAPVHVVPLAAWGVFGSPPFPDLGAEVEQELKDWRQLEQQQKQVQQQSGGVTVLGPGGTGDGGQEGTQGLAAVTLPLVCVAKLTPEKGLPVVLGLARRMAGRVRFRVVAGDPAVTEALERVNHEVAAAVPAAAGAGAGARAAAAVVEVVEPRPDISQVLRGCCCVLAPSLWLEAWGMVVTEALLRGLPALVSNLGGLPEAGLRVCPAVRVAPVEVPVGEDGAPDWALRRFPAQDLDAWERALTQLLLGARVRPSARHEAAGHEAGPWQGAERGGAAAKDGSVIGRRGQVEEGQADQAEEVWAWEAVRRAGLAAAKEHVAGAQGELRAFLEWLNGLAGAPSSVG